MFILIQRIQIQWAKFSRGAEMATRRNALARALPFPPVMGVESSGILYHSVVFSDENGFGQALESRLTTPERLRDPHLQGLKLEFEDGVLTARYRYAAWWVGQPTTLRTHIRKALRAQPGEVVRLEHNGRFNIAGAWLYRHYIFNLTATPDPHPAVFLNREPDQQFLDVVRL